MRLERFSHPCHGVRQESVLHSETQIVTMKPGKNGKWGEVITDVLTSCGNKEQRKGLTTRAVIITPLAMLLILHGRFVCRRKGCPVPCCAWTMGMLLPARWKRARWKEGRKVRVETTHSRFPPANVQLRLRFKTTHTNTSCYCSLLKSKQDS
jgi:hypothetical protein